MNRVLLLGLTLAWTLLLAAAFANIHSAARYTMPLVWLTGMIALSTRLETRSR
jgi:hypothetical protein